MSLPTLGRVVATELKPSTPHQFHFWTTPHAPCGIGTIVRVGEGERSIFAVVTEGFAYADLARPLDAVIGAGGDPDRHADAGAEPSEIRLWNAAVLRQIPEEPLQPVPFGTVSLATDADVRVALRMDAYVSDARSTGLPRGLYAAGGLAAPVLLDADFLLGPEAAHVNISGVSGLATKTSAVTFLLSSIFQTFPAAKGSVAAVCFNVKGPDLCFLDQPARARPKTTSPSGIGSGWCRRRSTTYRLRALQGRRCQPQHLAQQPRDLGAGAAAGVGTARDSRFRRSGAEP